MDEVEIPDTGERMIPGFHHAAVVYAEHLVRYVFAAQFVRGKRVLDVASGVGYGADLLRSAGAAEVVALDRSPEALRYGEKHHSKFRPAYVVGHAESLPVRSGQFDVIASFETIEHIPDHQRFLAEVKRALRQDGVFIVSTPNKGIYVEGNPFHTKEFTFVEFEETLKGHFGYVRTLSQDDWIASAVFLPDEVEGADKPVAGQLGLFRAVGKSPSETLYMVSLCSDVPLPAVGQEVVLTSLYEMRQNLELVAQRDAEIERLKSEHDASLAKKDAVIRELREVHEGLSREMEVLQGSLGYRLLAGYRGMIGRLLPPASLRGRAYLAFVRALRALLDRFASSLPRRR